MTTWDDTRLTLQERCAVGTSRGIADAQRAKCEAWVRDEVMPLLEEALWLFGETEKEVRSHCSVPLMTDSETTEEIVSWWQKTRALVAAWKEGR